MLTEQALKEFEILWKKDHPNLDIDPDVLLEMATRVMTMVRIIHYESERRKDE